MMICFKDRSALRHFLLENQLFRFSEIYIPHFAFSWNSNPSRFITETLYSETSNSFWWNMKFSVTKPTRIVFFSRFRRVWLIWDEKSAFSWKINIFRKYRSEPKQKQRLPPPPPTPRRCNVSKYCFERRKVTGENLLFEQHIVENHTFSSIFQIKNIFNQKKVSRKRQQFQFRNR